MGDEVVFWWGVDVEFDVYVVGYLVVDVVV